MKVLITLIAVLFFTLPTVHAQDESDDCTIDLSNAIALLADAQVDAIDDTDAALSKIERAREVLEAVEEECAEGRSGRNTRVTLNAVYEAPNETFTVNYPTNWRVNEFTPAEDDLGGGVVIGNQDAELPTEEEPLAEGEQLLLVGVGPASFIGIGGLTEEDVPLEERIASRLTTIDEQTIDPESVETFAFNEYTAAEATAINNGVAQYYLVIEIEYENQYIVVGGIGAEAELESLQQLVRTVAQTVQINDEE